VDFPETTAIPWLFFKGQETSNIIIRTIDNIQSKNLFKTDSMITGKAIKTINDGN
jgi:hypothetical protein